MRHHDRELVSDGILIPRFGPKWKTVVSDTNRRSEHLIESIFNNKAELFNEGDIRVQHSARSFRYNSSEHCDETRGGEEDTG